MQQTTQSKSPVPAADSGGASPVAKLALLLLAAVVLYDISLQLLDSGGFLQQSWQGVLVDVLLPAAGLMAVLLRRKWGLVLFAYPLLDHAYLQLVIVPAITGKSFVTQVEPLVVLALQLTSIMLLLLPASRGWFDRSGGHTAG